MFKYGNYIAKPEVDSDAGILYGRVLNISATITFQGENVREAEQNFRKAVDLYIQTCQEQGKEPEKPFSGKLPFRTTPEIHRDIYMAATHANKSINAWMEDTLSNAARKIDNKPSAIPENRQEFEISIIEYERLLAQLQDKIVHLQRIIQPFLDEKGASSWIRLFREMKPALKDKELPDLLEKVETIQERLRSVQYQEANLLALMEQPTEPTPSNTTGPVLSNASEEGSTYGDIRTLSGKLGNT